MLVYLVNIFLIIIWGIVLIYSNPTPCKKAWFCGIASFQWILISGLRHVSIGADTLAYKNAFNEAKHYSWSQIWNTFQYIYFEGGNFNTSSVFINKDPGYIVFEKIIHYFTDDYQIYLIIIAIILFFSMGYFIYKNSEDACFSYLLFSCLFYSFYAITGHRQTIATALVVFVGYEFIKKRKFIPFLLIALVAFTIHKSSLVFVLFYFFARKKLTWPYFLILGTVTGIVYFGGAPRLLKIAQIFGYKEEEAFVLLPTTYIVLMSLIGLAAVVLSHHVILQETEKSMAIHATILAAFLTLFTILDQGMMRVQQYYALFLMISIPSMIKCTEKKKPGILTVGCCATLILLTILKNPQYLFFWERF